MFPVEQCAFGNTDTACEFALRKASPSPDCRDIDRGDLYLMDMGADILAMSVVQCLV